jgi:Glucose / Sorbosone dehydrogenase
MVRWPLASLLVLCTAAVAGCDGDSSSSSPPPSGSAESVTGRERVAWIQGSVSSSDMMVLQFAAYIDGTRHVLEGFTCSPSSGDSFSCSAPLPTLTARRHTLEIVSFFNSSTGLVESPRSAALQLVVSGIVAQLSAPASSDETIAASDGRELHADVLAGDLVDPADAALDARGRVFVVERRGTLRIIDPDSAATDAAPIEPLVGARDQGARALSIALAPDFTRSALLYTLSAQATANGSRLFVTRFRELAGRLGEAAVVVSYEVSGLGARDSGLGEPDGSLRFGPDGAMYIAVGSSDGDSGQILRFLSDGRIPAENPGASPLYWSLQSMPAGIDWQPANVSLWTIETSRTVDRFEVRRRGEPGGTALAARQPGAANDLPRLPRGTRASGLAIVNAPASPFDGDAIVSSIGLADLLRFDGSRADAPAGDPVRLLQGQFGAIGGVTTTSSGDIYFFTRNNEIWGAGRDALVRLRPVP